MWWAWDGPGLGHLRLTVRDSGVVADGVILGVAEGRPFRVAYEVRCDARFPSVSDHRAGDISPAGRRTLAPQACGRETKTLRTPGMRA
jgi:hypothetical protein